VNIIAAIVRNVYKDRWNISGEILTKLESGIGFHRDGIEVGAYDFLGCLDALEGTDGAFNFVKISNANIEKILLKYNLAWKSNRGPWAQHLNTGKIAVFRKKIYKALDKVRKKK